MARPKNKKGEEKPIGIWDFENYDKENDRASWSKFKTLGAKRYIVLEDGDLQCTVAGISKKAMKEAMEKEANDKKDRKPKKHSSSRELSDAEKFWYNELTKDSKQMSLSDL